MSVFSVFSWPSRTFKVLIPTIQIRHKYVWSHTDRIHVFNPDTHLGMMVEPWDSVDKCVDKYTNRSGNVYITSICSGKSLICIEL